MSEFKHILFPIDGSSSAKKALEYVKDIAIKFDSHVTLFHSYEYTGIIGGYEVTPTYLLELDKELESRGHNILNEAKNILEKEGISVETILLKGDAGNLIEETIKDKNCDVIIMGSRGLGAVKGFLLGSVSNHVIHHSSCPVMIIKDN